MARILKKNKEEFKKLGLVDSEDESAEEDLVEDSSEGGLSDEARQENEFKREKRTTFLDVLFCFMNESKGELIERKIETVKFRGDLS